MKRIVSLVIIAILPVFAFATSTRMNLSEALRKEIVKLEAVNITGNYKGKAVKLTITNNSSSSIELKIDMGIILKPENPAFQPLVLAGEEQLTLKAHEKGNVDVEVFADNSYKAIPIEGLRYTYLRIAGDTLIKILRFIKDHSLFDHLGQAAVWTITNYHPINNVYERSRDSLSRKLISFIVEVTKREKPTFYASYTDNEIQAQPAYLAKMDKIYIPFDVSLKAAGTLSAVLFSPKGQPVKTIYEPQSFEPGTHRIIAELDPTGFETGKYSVKLTENEKTLQDKVILVNPPAYE